MEKAPKILSPMEMDKLQDSRINSDKELIDGGARTKNMRLEVTDEQIEKAREEMNSEFHSRIERAEFEARVREVAEKNFTAESYTKEIVKDGETPESFIWNGRRILRSTIHTIVKNLEKSGLARKNSKGFDSDKAIGIHELISSNKKSASFVDALNEIMKQYDKLFDGSEKIYYPSIKK